MLERSVGVRDDPQASLASRWLQRATGYCDHWNTVVSKASPCPFGPEFPCAPGMGDKCAETVMPSTPRQVWGAPESPHPPDLWPPMGHSSCPTELLPPAHSRASVLYPPGQGHDQEVLPKTGLLPSHPSTILPHRVALFVTQKFGLSGHHQPKS